jgi:hypothetical protein
MAEQIEKTSNIYPIARPSDVKIIRDLTKEAVSVNGYSMSQRKILGTTKDDVEIGISLRTYELMENDPAIAKCKQILLTGALSDELQLAPGAKESEVGPKEYETYVKIMEFCQRVIGGLQTPFRDTMSQLLGNAIRYGHGVAEIEWDYRIDGFSSRPKAPKATTNRFQATMEWLGITSRSNAEEGTDKGITRPSLVAEKTRLMPKGIKVKPRGTTRFVVDAYMNVLGLVPKYRDYKKGLPFDAIIDRDKFMVLTLNKRDEDPRGRSFYRPAFNWWQVKKEVPTELLRFVLEETVPKSVATLSKDAPPYEFDRDEDGNVQYNDPETRKDPKMLTQAESMGRASQHFRSGSGIVIPEGATFEPYKKSGGATDADIFGKVLKVIDNQIEYAILLQVLAQSEGEHQARSASQQVAELLYNLTFWIRWVLSMLVLTDLFETAVKFNFGEWAISYLPMVSLGDFVRRDWVQELEAISDSYFKGFIDDTQRRELAAWLNLPEPGPSRFELGQEAAELDPTTGEARQPAKIRPDKKNGDRNKGNSTEKNNGKTTKADAEALRLRFGNILGHHRIWVSRSKGLISDGPRANQ